MCMYVYIYIHMCVYLYIHIYVSVNIYIYIYIYVYIFFIYVYLYIYIYVCVCAIVQSIDLSIYRSINQSMPAVDGHPHMSPRHWRRRWCRRVGAETRHRRGCGIGRDALHGSCGWRLLDPGGLIKHCSSSTMMIIISWLADYQSIFKKMRKKRKPT